MQSAFKNQQPLDENSSSDSRAEAKIELGKRTFKETGIMNEKEMSPLKRTRQDEDEEVKIEKPKEELKLGQDQALLNSAS